ncbi:DUF4194 domain-containing protein [Simiduia curdlanivorans]|uniref:DUF4194 domain-containing protein n=1 Tax=Simiduia curdlanivorans TaxID=1492769 RepID=A0ABV8VBX3_9GAMM|nr:DUF4194 domain-containing protein [Simiduia curdlanivorans]MDN3639430.1 DUF4194 domain-containing protein [Simiduia curdlanivorans]
MSDLNALLEKSLAEKDLHRQQFQSLIQRLLDYGIICRDESQIEADFYDLFVRCEGIVDDYLLMAGIRFYHDKRFEYVRLVPPGARVPGVDDEANDGPAGGGLRANLSPMAVALTLVLAVEYEKSLREARVDEKGCASLSLEALNLSMKNLLGRSLPEQQLERRALFRQLRQLRLIRMASDADLQQGDSWLLIRPMILTLVNEDALAPLLAGEAKHASLLTDANGEADADEGEH